MVASVVLQISLDASSSFRSGYRCRHNFIDNLALSFALERHTFGFDFLVERFLIGGNCHSVVFVLCLSLGSDPEYSLSLDRTSLVRSNLVMSHGLPEQTHVSNYVFHRDHVPLGRNFSY